MLAISSDLIDMLDQCRVAVLAKFDLPSGSVGVWSWHYDVVVSGVTYKKAVGSLLLGDISGTMEMDAEAVSLKLGALNGDARAILNATDWHQAPTTIYRAFLDAYDNIVDVEAFYVGFLDKAPTIDAAGGQFIIDMTIENSNRELDRATGRTFNDADQIGISANDRFWKYVAAAVSTEINWGRDGPRFPV